MAKRPLSAADLDAHLYEQIGALQRSVQLFDDGYHLEARRIAVILRILLHSRKYPSLLKQMDRDEMDFVDSAPPFDPKNLIAFHGLVSLSFSKWEVSYTAKLDTDSPFALTPFAKWWKAIVFADRQDWQMSRADVVLTAADQDGGAHVDGALNADYAALRHENALGWLTDHGIPPTGDPVYAAIRQIAHEVLKTFISGYSKTADDVRAARRKSEISGGKMRFFPHEKKWFNNQTVTLLVPGLTYLAETVIDSITTGSVRMVANSAVTDPLTRAGLHSVPIVAGSDQNFGVFGEYTDAVIDRVSVKQLLK